MAAAFPDLVYIVWDDDCGIVSMRRGKVIFTCQSCEGPYTELPQVEICDKDFSIMMRPTDADPTCYAATWDYVPALLIHPEFPFHERAVAP